RQIIMDRPLLTLKKTQETPQKPFFGPHAPTRNQEITRCMEYLESTYPVFKDRRPLAIGVTKALLAGELPDFVEIGILAICMCRHVRRNSYVRSIAAGGSRYGLDGEAVGPISVDHMEHAKEIMDERRARRAIHNKRKKEAI
ncbi:MAG: ProQ/FINO family protein, partial [Candidatus Sedimenticola sp. (ex Thyasira tokunagai)]